MKLKCIVWNVRNLTGKGFRPGKYAHGVPLEKRLKQIMWYLKSEQPDLMFIIEAAPDVISVSMELGLALTGCRVEHTSNNNDGEAYILIRKLRPELQFGGFELYGEKVNGCRQSARLLVKFSKWKICFIVVHPPAPRNNNLEKRLHLIGAHADDARIDLDHKGHTVVLCGDTNIRADEFDDLRDKMTSLNYSHIGPFTEGANTRTTLRQFTTIMANEGEDTESQPYDQVWRQPFPTGVMLAECKALEASINVPIKISEVAGWLARHLEYLGLPPFAKNGSQEKENKKRTKKAIESFHEYLAIRIPLLDFPKKDVFKLLDPDSDKNALKLFNNARSLIGKMDDEFRKHMKVDPAVGLNRDQLEVRECDYLLGVQSESMKTVKTNLIRANAFLDLVTAGKGAPTRDRRLGQHLATLDKIIFEYAISDHLPVSFTLRLGS